MDRALFLDRVRRRLDGPEPHNLAHPLVEVDGVPEVAYAADLTDLAAAFTTSVAALGARCGAIATEEAAAVEPLLRSAGLDVLPFEVASAAVADLGVTGAAYGIAATGSLALSAARAGGRTAGLLPPVHLAFVRRRNLVPNASALFRALPERFSDGLPSQLVLATGPSRTGDIELILTTGVHGPGTVVIGILDDGVLEA